MGIKTNEINVGNITLHDTGLGGEVIIGDLRIREYNDIAYSTKNLTTTILPGDTGWEAIWSLGVDGQSDYDIGPLTQCGHNNMLFLINGSVYSGIGAYNTYDCATSGRGLSNTVAPLGVTRCQKVSFPTENKIIEVGGGYHSFAYALDDQGNLYMWGGNPKGQCGTGDTNPVPYPNFS